VAAWIAGSVGSIGIFLAALGLYGLAAFLVAQRTREIAIRMALGASQRDIRSMVLGQAARLGAIGAVVGIVFASGLGRLIQGLSLLVGVQPTDPLTFGGMALLKSAVLFAAATCRAAGYVNRSRSGVAGGVGSGHLSQVRKEVQPHRDSVPTGER
jgi:putative ABC transport system permease protein